ncbi:hypothetical protein SOM46_23340 [Pseudomonas fluorescens]|uniref:hypothetical protein n=1 Tax=Pseudomonas fluorescens TaxID=294 RepID=UPI001782104F|nr:hypothetical protein [Pseudomonas fluorescens]MBD8239280.1 hypothetical protein [Pseudomonas fluorescens]MDY0897871.1 hypothetical protein [Pseudomonas fluorescens]
MTIKNWTVTTERVKNKDVGLSEYASYLASAKHKNHKNTTIYTLFNSDVNTFLNNTIQETITFDAKNKKGGRKVESFAQSFNFILPPPHKPTPDEWKKIAKELVNTIHKELEIKEDVNQFGRACFLNIHDQANPHLNLLVPRIFSGQRLADLDRKNVLAKLKLQFNQSVLKHCNIDHTHHNPLRTNVGRRKTAQRHEYDKAKEEAQNASKLVFEAQNSSAMAVLAQKETETKLKELEVKEIELDNKRSQIMLEKAKLNFIVKAFNDFKSSLIRWVNSVRNDSTLDILINRQEVEEKANRITESDNADESDVLLVDNMIGAEVTALEKNGLEVTRPNYRRRNKLDSFT